MSRSRTYRSVRLTEEQRAALGRLARESRLAELLPRLRGHLEFELAVCSSGQGLPSRTRADLSHRIESVAGLAGLRALSVEIGGIGERAESALRNDAGGLGRDVLPRPALARSAEPFDGSSRAGLGFDAAVIEGEMDSVEQVAANLGVESGELGTARMRLIEAKRLVSTAQWSRADRALEAARSALAIVDARAADALEAAECRARTVAAATRAMERMGYRVDGPAIDRSATRLTGVARDGRHATVDVTDDGESLEVFSVFTDAASAVAPSHSAADNVCEVAASDQVEFSRNLANEPGLSVDRPHATERPIRGVATRNRTSRADVAQRGKRGVR